MAAMSGTMAEMAAMSSQMKGIVDAVTAASREQSSGVEQIGKALLDLNRITQTTAANAEEGAAAAEELSGQAKAVSRIAHQLNVLIDGRAELVHS